MSAQVMASISRPARQGLAIFVPLAVALLLAGVVFEPGHAWSGLLTAGFAGMTIAVGATFFAAVMAVSGARWIQPIAKVPALVGATVTAPAVLLAVVFAVGLTALYPWAAIEPEHMSHLLHEKIAWLNPMFFMARAAVLLIIFIFITGALFRPRADGKAGIAPGRAAASIVVLALALSVASWDWVMSLEPEWFSTMFGVYGFSGAFQGGIAAIILGAHWLQSRGDSEVNFGHRQIRDLGSLLFGFSMFWAYIWFCQYMLIWYANVPEETFYYAERLHGAWAMLFWLNPILNFVVPFIVLLSSRARNSASTIAQMAGLVLLGRWLDVYLMVAPPAQAEPRFPIYGIAAMGLLVIAMVYVARKRLARGGQQAAA